MADKKKKPIIKKLLLKKEISAGTDAKGKDNLGMGMFGKGTQKPSL